jgi:hypothetical protein
MQETLTDYPEYTDRNGTRWAIIARPGELRFHSEHAPLTHWDSWPVTGEGDVEILLAHYAIGSPASYAKLARTLWQRCAS